MPSNAPAADSHAVSQLQKGIRRAADSLLQYRPDVVNFLILDRHRALLVSDKLHDAAYFKYVQLGFCRVRNLHKHVPGKKRHIHRFAPVAPVMHLGHKRKKVVIPAL